MIFIVSRIGFLDAISFTYLSLSGKLGCSYSATSLDLCPCHSCFELFIPVNLQNLHKINQTLSYLVVVDLHFFVVNLHLSMVYLGWLANDAISIIICRVYLFYINKLSKSILVKLKRRKNFSFLNQLRIAKKPTDSFLKS